MNANINDFMSKNKPKYKLRKYSEEILFLIKEGYTQANVLVYLKNYYGEDVTRQTLSSHLKFLKQIQIKEGNVKVTSPSKTSENDKKKALDKIKKIGEDNFN